MLLKKECSTPIIREHTESAYICMHNRYIHKQVELRTCYFLRNNLETSFIKIFSGMTGILIIDTDCLCEWLTLKR